MNLPYRRLIISAIVFIIGVILLVVSIKNGALDYIRQIGSLICFDCMGIG